jgi:hypothetical protein
VATKKTFLLRIDPAMWDQLERWAAEDFRSVNGQIEFLLHQAISNRYGAKAHAAPPAEASADAAPLASRAEPPPES